jgi:hypothetical protein
MCREVGKTQLSLFEFTITITRKQSFFNEGIGYLFEMRAALNGDNSS